MAARRTPGLLLSGLLFVGLLLAGCAGEERAAEPRSSADAPASDLAPVSVPDLSPAVPGGYVDHWVAVGRWINERARRRERLNPGDDVQSLEEVLHAGEHLVLYALGVRGRAGPPEEAANEVLIVVQGQGRIELAGSGSRELKAEDVLVLPAGARRAVVSDPSDPILGLVIRSRHVASERVDPILTTASEAFPRLLLVPQYEEGPRGPKVPLLRRRLGDLPGALRVDAVALHRFLAPQYHREHDAVVFVLSGACSGGLGSSGHLLREGSLMFANEGLTYYVWNEDEPGPGGVSRPHPPILALVIYGADDVGDDVHMAEGGQEALAQPADGSGTGPTPAGPGGG